MTDHTTITGDRDTDHKARQREENFDVSGPIALRIKSSSGDVHATAGEDTHVSVTLRATGASAEQLLKDTEVRFDEATRTLTIVTAGALPDAWGMNSLGMGLRRTLLGGSMRDVDVFVVAPRQSSFDVNTRSGDCEFRGETGDVDVSSASGDVVVDDADSIKVRSASGDVSVGCARTSVSASTASGDVVIGECEGKTKIESASGDVHAKSSGEVTDVSTASGDIVVAATRTGRVGVRTASGDVRVAVKEGLDIDVVARSVSGHLTSDIPLSGGSGDDAANALGVTIATVSGDVRIVRA